MLCPRTTVSYAHLVPQMHADMGSEIYGETKQSLPKSLWGGRWPAVPEKPPSSSPGASAAHSRGEDLGSPNLPLPPTALVPVSRVRVLHWYLLTAAATPLPWGSLLLLIMPSTGMALGESVPGPPWCHLLGGPTLHQGPVPTWPETQGYTQPNSGAAPATQGQLACCLAGWIWNSDEGVSFHLLFQQWLGLNQASSD